MCLFETAGSDEISYRWATTAAGDQTRGIRGAATIPVINAKADHEAIATVERHLFLACHAAPLNGCTLPDAGLGNRARFHDPRSNRAISTFPTVKGKPRSG